ncbi:MAG: hypothetical protein AAFV53_18795, partial [Myxococcota bacterium]
MRLRSISLALLLSGAVLAGPVLAEELHLQALSVSSGQTADRAELVLTLNSSAQGTAVSAFPMTNPDQLVVDVADARIDPDLALDGAGDLVLGARVETITDDQGVIGRLRLQLA